MSSILKRTFNFDSGSSYLFSNKDLVKLIIPLVIEQLLIMVVGMADTMMVSQAGEAAVSGVGLIDMINNLVITVLAALASGGAVIVAQYVGSKDAENAVKASSQLITISFLVSFVLMLFCLAFYQQIISLFFGSIALDVMQACIIYFIITAFSFPFLGVYNSASAIYRSEGNTKIIMYLSFLMNAINIIGNFIGVLILHAGVAGVAIPTLISRIIGCVIIMIMLLRKKSGLSIQLKEVFSIDRSMIHRILNIAVPNGIENGLFTLGRVLVTSIVALFGTSQIAANSVAGSIDQVAVVVINGLNLAIVTVVGQCMGAKEDQQAKYYIKKLMAVGYFMTFFIGGFVILILPLLLNLYSLSPQAREYTFILVVIHNIMCTLLHPTSFILPNGLRAAGDVKYSMYLGIASMILFRLGVAWLFGIVFHMGVIGVWIAMAADWACRSVGFVIRYRSQKWLDHQVI